MTLDHFLHYKVELTRCSVSATMADKSITEDSKDFSSYQRKTGLQAFTEKVKLFIWNRHTDEYLSRTKRSWALILLYYIVLYGIIVAYFAVAYAIFFVAIDKNWPRLQGKDSILQSYPALGMRPNPKLETTLIRFEQGQASSYKPYADHIMAFLDQYENDKQVGENFDDCSTPGAFPPPGKVCRFDLKDLVPCNWQNDYGYDEGRPCVLLKLNKVYGWVPETFNNQTGDCPEELKGNCDPNFIPVTCEGVTPMDKENIGPLEYYPQAGFPIKFYPYTVQEGYRPPLVMVKFAFPRNGHVIMVWCKAWARNIYHHKNDRAGSVYFELLVD